MEHPSPTSASPAASVAMMAADLASRPGSPRVRVARHATSACRVDYRVVSQWSNEFVAVVSCTTSVPSNSWPSPSSRRATAVAEPPWNAGHRPGRTMTCASATRPGTAPSPARRSPASASSSYFEANYATDDLRRDGVPCTDTDMPSWWLRGTK